MSSTSTTENIFSTLPRFTSFMTALISFMTASVPFLYLIGYLNHLGSLSAYGLEGNFFTKSVQEHVVGAFFVFLEWISSIISVMNTKFYAFLIVSLFLFIIGLAMIWILNRSKQIEQKVKKIKNHKHFEYVAVPSLMALLSFAIPYTIVAILAFILLLPLGAYWQGQNSAKNRIEGFKGCELKDLDKRNKCFFITKADKPIADGMLIAKSPSHVALWDGNVANIYPLKDESFSVKYGTLTENVDK